jgi:adenylate kinase family enzyme
MKVHIIGPAGSGKSTLARSLAAQHGATWHDLDEVVYGSGGERATEEIAERLAGILGSEGWVTEGAYRAEWLRPVLEALDRVIWLDVSLPLCLWRIFKRHVVAELRRNNDHPGWESSFAS